MVQLKKVLVGIRLLVLMNGKLIVNLVVSLTKMYQVQIPHKYYVSNVKQQYKTLKHYPGENTSLDVGHLLMVMRRKEDVVTVVVIVY
jgi:hypothetical protein